MLNVGLTEKTSVLPSPAPPYFPYLPSPPTSPTSLLPVLPPRMDTGKFNPGKCSLLGAKIVTIISDLLLKP